MQHGLGRHLVDVLAAGPAAAHKGKVQLAATNRDLRIDAERGGNGHARDRVALSTEEQAAKDHLAAIYLQAALQPISLEEALQQASTNFGPNFGIDAARAQRFAQMLINSGELVRVGELVFHQQALDDLRVTLQKYKAEHGTRIDVGIFKELTNVSRKYAIPLLEYLDRQRVTRRFGDAREIL